MNDVVLGFVYPRGYVVTADVDLELSWVLYADKDRRHSWFPNDNQDKNL